MATILSAQSTDARVNLVTPALFKRYPNAAALAKATTRKLEPQIHSTGFFRAKSKALLGMAQALVATTAARCRPAWTRWSSCPASDARPRTSCSDTRSACRGCRSIATCCASRTASASPKSDDPVVVEQQLGDALPKERWTRTSDTLILHGRRICRPKPLCDVCVVRDACDLPDRRRRGRGRASTKGSASARGASRERRPASAKVKAAAIANRGKRLELAPLDRKQFEQLVAEALASIPRRFRDAMKNIAIVVEDEPSRELLRRDGDRAAGHAARPVSGDAAHRAHWGYGNTLPDRVLIFQGPHERDSEDEDDLVVAIGETLIHEIGHYFGLSEEEIEEIEEKYWRGDDVECYAER